MDGADGVAFGSAGPANGPWPDGGNAFTTELAQAKQQHAVADARRAAGGRNDEPSQSTDPSSFLPDPPSPPDPPSDVPATVAPACHALEAMGQVGGGFLGGTAEGLRQAAPGALAGTIVGAAAGAEWGAPVGAGAGAFAGGVGALPGAGIGATTGALWGGASGAVLGGAPGFVHGFQDGVGPGATRGGSAGRWLDHTSIGQWLQGCPAPADDTATNGPATLESRRDSGLTQPTGQIGGKPGGLRQTTAPGAESADKAQVDSENQVADATARAGYRTVQRPTDGPNRALTPERMKAEGLRPAADPDLLLENRIWDVYTPEADKASSIRNAIQDKIDKRQTHRVLVDLRGTTQTPASVRAAIREKPLQGVKEVMFFTNQGLAKPFRP